MTIPGSRPPRGRADTRGSRAQSEAPALVPMGLRLVNAILGIGAIVFGAILFVVAVTEAAEPLRRWGQWAGVGVLMVLGVQAIWSARRGRRAWISIVGDLP